MQAVVAAVGCVLCTGLDSIDHCVLSQLRYDVLDGHPLTLVGLATFLTALVVQSLALY